MLITTSSRFSETIQNVGVGVRVRVMVKVRVPVKLGLGLGLGHSSENGLPFFYSHQHCAKDAESQLSLVLTNESRDSFTKD